MVIDLRKYDMISDIYVRNTYFNLVMNQKMIDELEQLLKEYDHDDNRIRIINKAKKELISDSIRRSKLLDDVLLYYQLKNQSLKQI